jgi:glucose/arabinose dehydrogenase
MMAPSAPGGAPTLYQTMCASCHGAKLTGERAQSLVDDKWTFGGDDQSIAESIREGRPGTAMAPFKAVLSEQQIRSLVIFIHEEATRARGRDAIPTPAIDRVVPSEKHAFKIETVVPDLDTPWGMQFLPDGRMLVTERPGKLRVITPGKPLPSPIEGIPAVWAVQDGGLMDVTLHPDFAKNGWIYLSYSEPATPPSGASNTVIVRGKIREGKWVDQEVLFRAPKEQYWVDNSHFGSRFLWDRAGHLFYSIGDRGHQDDAQSLALPNGKVHRINDDGSIPKDNPFVGKADALGSIWSYGNRNPQGLAFHPVTGDLWESEHGPRGGDELNVIEPGKNYGWPVITYGMNYDGTPITDKTEAPGMEQPIVQWTPSIAACPIAFYTGNQFPKWKNDLFVGALVFQELRRLSIDGRKVTHQEVLFKGIGRVRDVVNGPDGYLYVLLNNPGRIVRLAPATPEERAAAKR